MQCGGSTLGNRKQREGHAESSVVIVTSAHNGDWAPENSFVWFFCSTRRRSTFIPVIWAFTINLSGQDADILRYIFGLVKKILSSYLNIYGAHRG